MNEIDRISIDYSVKVRRVVLGWLGVRWGINQLRPTAPHPLLLSPAAQIMSFDWYLLLNRDIYRWISFGGISAPGKLLHISRFKSTRTGSARWVPALRWMHFRSLDWWGHWSAQPFSLTSCWKLLYCNQPFHCCWTTSFFIHTVKQDIFAGKVLLHPYIPIFFQ